MDSVPRKYLVMRLLGRPELWLALLLLWETVSALRSWHTPFQTNALTEWARWASGIGLALALAKGLIQARRVAWLLTFLAGGLAVSGLYQAAQGRSEVPGPFGDHQLYGSALLALLPFALAHGICSHKQYQRWTAQTIALALAVSLALCQTRSAWIGAIVGVVVFAALWLWTARPPRRALVLPLLLGVGMAFAFAAISETTEMQKPLALRVHSLRTWTADTSWQGRLIAWRGASRMAEQSPWAGLGLGQYPARQRAFTHVGRALISSQRPSLSEQAHDFYLQTLVEIGGIGLGLYGLAGLAFLGRGYVFLRAQRGHPLGSRALLAIAGLSLIASQGVDAIANPSWQFGEVSLLFWTSLGVALSAINRPRSVLSFAAPPLRALRVVVPGAVAVAVAAPFLHWGLLPPVEAYTGGTGLTLTSVTLVPAVRRVVLRGFSATFPVAAIGHFHVTQSGEAAPDESVTWNGSIADGVLGTKFRVEGAWEPPRGTTGFSGDPAERNLLTVDAREGTKTGHAIAVRAECFVKDDGNEQGRIVVSRPLSIPCYP